MDGWALATSTDRKVLQTIVEASLEAAGFEKAKPASRSKMRVELRSHEHGTLLLVQNEIPNPALARDITKRLGSQTKYLELRLEDTTVSGTRIALPSGLPEDIAQAAVELLAGWNVGDKKFLTESYEGLVEALLEVNDTKKPVVLTYATAPLSRVGALVRAIQAGGKWERTSIGGQPAIKVVGAGGSQISVLTPAEEKELLATIDSAPAPSAPAPAMPARMPKKSLPPKKPTTK